MNTDNLLIKQPARYTTNVAPAELDESPDWYDARARHARAITQLDLHEECSEFLLAAVKSGNAELVGRVLLAAVNARLSCAADIAVYGEFRRPDSEDAAAAELHRDLSPLLRASLAASLEGSAQ